MNFFAFEVYFFAISEGDTRSIWWRIGAIYRKRTRVPDSMACATRRLLETRRKLYIGDINAGLKTMARGIQQSVFSAKASRMF